MLKDGTNRPFSLCGLFPRYSFFFVGIFWFFALVPAVNAQLSQQQSQALIDIDDCLRQNIQPDLNAIRLDVNNLNVSLMSQLFQMGQEIGIQTLVVTNALAQLADALDGLNGSIGGIATNNWGGTITIDGTSQIHEADVMSPRVGPYQFSYLLPSYATGMHDFLSLLSYINKSQYEVGRVLTENQTTIGAMLGMYNGSLARQGIDTLAWTDNADFMAQNQVFAVNPTVTRNGPTTFYEVLRYINSNVNSGNKAIAQNIAASAESNYRVATNEFARLIGYLSSNDTEGWQSLSVDGDTITLTASSGSTVETLQITPPATNNNGVLEIPWEAPENRITQQAIVARYAFADQFEGGETLTVGSPTGGFNSTVIDFGGGHVIDISASVRLMKTNLSEYIDMCENIMTAFWAVFWSLCAVFYVRRAANC